VPGVRLSATALRVEFEDAGVLPGPRNGRVRRGQLTEPAREPRLRRVVQMVLATEEDDLVLVQRIRDELDGAWLEAGAEPDAGDFGADVAGDPADVDGWCGHGLSLLPMLSTSIKSTGVSYVNISNRITSLYRRERRDRARSAGSSSVP
jgi:hypothetical protein